MGYETLKSVQVDNEAIYGQTLFISKGSIFEFLLKGQSQETGRFISLFLDLFQERYDKEL
jgi:hypothetical protein